MCVAVAAAPGGEVVLEVGISGGNRRYRVRLPSTERNAPEIGVHNHPRGVHDGLKPDSLRGTQRALSCGDDLVNRDGFARPDAGARFFHSSARQGGEDFGWSVTQSAHYSVDRGKRP